MCFFPPFVCLELCSFPIYLSAVEHPLKVFVPGAEDGMAFPLKKPRTRGMAKEIKCSVRENSTPKIPFFWFRTMRPCQSAGGLWEEVTVWKMRAGTLCGTSGIHSGGKWCHCPFAIPQALNRIFGPMSRGCVPRSRAGAGLSLTHCRC